MPQPLVATFFRPHTGNVPRTVILGYREGLPPPRAPHHQYNGRVLAEWNPNPNATTRSFATRSQFALTLHEEVVNAPSLLQLISNATFTLDIINRNGGYLTMGIGCVRGWGRGRARLVVLYRGRGENQSLEAMSLPIR